MKVVLDTNVLLSALISPHAPPHRILDAWREGRFDLATCKEQLDEIRHASRYAKFRHILQPNRVGRLINDLTERPLVAVPSARLELADPDDAFLLALTAAADADYLVTGDRRAGLLEMGHHGRTRIVAPARFCADVLKD